MLRARTTSPCFGRRGKDNARVVCRCYRGTHPKSRVPRLERVKPPQVVENRTDTLLFAKMFVLLVKRDEVPSYHIIAELSTAPPKKIIKTLEFTKWVLKILFLLEDHLHRQLGGN
jgi:hypothetical protein